MNESNIVYFHNSPISDLTDYIYKSIGLTIYIFASLGNLTSIVIFLKKSWRKNVCVLYLTCYTLASLCFVNIFILSTTINNITGHSLPLSSNTFCKLYLYTFYLFATLPPNVLIFASIDRLLISSRSVDTRLYSSKRLAYVSLGISSCLWTIYYLHLLIKSIIQQISPTSHDCAFDQSDPYLTFAYYSLVATNMSACLTIAILVLMSLKNIRYFREMPRRERTQQIHSMKRKDFQLLRCLCVLDVIYIFFSMLSLIYDILYTFFLKDETTLSIQQSIYSFLSTIFTFLTIIPYASCFWIFFILSKAFRYEIKRLIDRIIGRCLTLWRNDENNNMQINVFVRSS